MVMRALVFKGRKTKLKWRFVISIEMNLRAILIKTEVSVPSIIKQPLKSLTFYINNPEISPMIYSTIILKLLRVLLACD